MMTRDRAIAVLREDANYASLWEIAEAVDMAIEALKEQRPHGKCNQCRYYEGVHGVQGHAPCSFWKLGGVLWNDYCSRYEKEGEEK